MESAPTSIAVDVSSEGIARGRGVICRGVGGEREGRGDWERGPDHDQGSQHIASQPQRDVHFSEKCAASRRIHRHGSNGPYQKKHAPRASQASQPRLISIGATSIFGVGLASINGSIGRSAKHWLMLPQRTSQCSEQNAGLARPRQLGDRGSGFVQPLQVQLLWPHVGPDVPGGSSNHEVCPVKPAQGVGRSCSRTLMESNQHECCLGTTCSKGVRYESLMSMAPLTASEREREGGRERERERERERQRRGGERRMDVRREPLYGFHICSHREGVAPEPRRDWRSRELMRLGPQGCSGEPLWAETPRPRLPKSSIIDAVDCPSMPN